MAKIDDWSVKRRIESLRQMDRKLSDMNVASRYTIWQEYGGGIKQTEEKTIKNWERIAENDELYNDVLFCYMVCTLEDYTLSSFGNI